MTALEKVGLTTVVPAIAILLLTACASSGPLFVNVETITIQQISPDGLTKRDINHGKALKETSDCLYSSVQVTEEHSRGRRLLQTTFLIDVKDAYGIRSFELFTDQHLKGNKGNYYHNACLYKLIQQQ